MTLPKLHIVVWDDAHGDTVSFTSEEVKHQPYRYTSVGFLVRTDEVGVSLAREIGADGVWRDHEFIPRIMVVDEFEISGKKVVPRLSNGTPRTRSKTLQQELAEDGKKALELI